MDRRQFLRRFAGEAPAPPPSPPPVSSGLEPYTGPWDEPQAAHLIRRALFGLTRADLVDALFRSPAGAVDHLVDTAVARPLPAAPSWYNTAGTNIAWRYEWQEAWYAEMRAGGLKERMTLLWHDHFVTAIDVYGHAAFAYQYLTKLRTHALGNFRTLLHAVGTLPAMLIYLDGEDSSAGNINENYARELLELFSMGRVGPDGQDNYTQQDIVEAARALTGWVVNMSTLRGEFDPSRHDGGAKTIFGRTGTWDYDDVHDILFDEREEEIASWVAQKIYSWFVHPVPNPEVVAGMAQTLRQNDFEVAPVVRQLLKSAHFYEEAFVGSRIKSPCEYLVGLTRELGIVPPQALLGRFRETGYNLGQDLLNPPTVAGWPGYAPDEYRAWITTGSVPERRAEATNALEGNGAFPSFDPLPLVEALSDATSAAAIARDLAAHLLPAPLDDDDLTELEAILLDGAPWWEWVTLYQSNPEAARQRVRLLLDHLVNLPEYQLT
ncbi:MAG: DUF1800 domain-containing protein [Rubricoccaceae bacterium]|nr:DUF1800 domain-containing protein [Rubricoccaceae bacterium]